MSNIFKSHLFSLHIWGNFANSDNNPKIKSNRFAQLIYHISLADHQQPSTPNLFSTPSSSSSRTDTSGANHL